MRKRKTTTVVCSSSLNSAKNKRHQSSSCLCASYLHVVRSTRRDLGAGKTCFARGFIRGYLSNQEEIVTSPTYLLDNTYNGFDSMTQKPVTYVTNTLFLLYNTQLESVLLLLLLTHILVPFPIYWLTYSSSCMFCSIHHMDLYRLNGPDDVHILGMPQIFTNSVCLVEWPCRLGNELIPKERLEVCIIVSEEDGSSRTVELRAYGEWWRESVETASCCVKLDDHLNGSPLLDMRHGSCNPPLPWPNMTNLARTLWSGIVQQVFLP